jgi:peptidyl-prolyl cis-trans isomerase B (cyclophilin B)
LYYSIFNKEFEMESKSELTAVIDTGKGKIRLKLFADKVPVTVANFVNLAQRGYYEGLTFHRVIANFMIQGGCPHGDGRGGPGYQFQDECIPELRHDRPGVLSMANAGPNTNGSQFFVTHVPTPWLDGKHTVFGSVVGDEDQGVVNRVGQGDQIHSVTIEGDTSGLMSAMAERLTEWNEALDRNFTHLKKP